MPSGRRASRFGRLVLLPWLIAASTPSLPPLPDPYAAPPKGVVASLLRRSQFGEAGADAAIQRWLAANAHGAAVDRAAMWHRLCSDYGLRGWYEAALHACTSEATVAPRGEADDDIAMARALQGLPPVRAIGSARVPLMPNKLGSRSASVVVDGFALPWFIDSGAEVSVVSQSVADRIEVRMLTGNVQVGTTTAPVQGRMGVIDTLSIGGATVENLPVLVLPDAQLTIADLPTIPAILGLPALAAFHRVAWLDGASELALGDDAPAVPADAPRLYWHEEGVGVPISTARGTRGAHLDSGANASYLRAAGHALLSRAQERAAVTHDRRIGGAGGVVATRHKVLPKLTIKLAGAPVTLTDVSIIEQDKEGAARIGDDAIRQLGELALDFDRMRVSAAPLAS
ncbi:retropepsin-like aspartic protease family protein [Hephaestia mangrovi]|uniref:retropepsin-like aspartic protease family protein n=1 Tax=Hephaestia mangrovi TaxID=2873268 RepID=UPI001CA623EF|nr:retroviral-like aspartic protease family protein [Hephaestia mangrovi]